MNTMINDFINQYGTGILYTVLTALAGYLGVAIKNIYKKFIDNKTKKEVVATAVKAVEQLYKDLHGEEKLDRALGYATEMLDAKGIKITDIELRLLIEASLAEFNKAFNEKKEDVGTAVSYQREDK